VKSDRATDQLLQGTSFYPALTAEQSNRLREDIVSRPFGVGTYVRRRGTVADGWLGVASGMVRIENSAADGRHTTLTHFSSGCWFGEGTLLKGDPWPFDAIAVVDSVVAFVPFRTFEWLLDSSVPFNRFLLNQLNARLGQFVERCEHLRLHDADHHVVHCLVEMVDPRLYPTAERNITLSQEELARLAGVSRSVVSRVLHKLERESLLRVEYRSIRLLDPERLRKFSDAEANG
jgi:CRP/FNR family transcriptional regulator, cyclic AMP receptor protein